MRHEASNKRETRKMTDFQDRIRVERAELSAKLDKLGEFLSTDMCRALPVGEQCALRLQATFMELYDDVLCDRINNFEVSKV